MFSKIIRKRTTFQEPTLRRESTAKRENLSGESHGDRGRVSTWRIRRWRKRSGILVVYSRILHLWLSYWTEFNFRAERRIIPDIPRFMLLNETPPRRNIRCGRRNGRGWGPPRQILNRRRRTREGPASACVQTPFPHRDGACKGGRANWRPAVVPSCRRGKNLQWDAQGGRAGLPARVSGRHVVRDDSPHPSLPKPAVFRWQ